MGAMALKMRGQTVSSGNSYRERSQPPISPYCVSALRVLRTVKLCTFSHQEPQHVRGICILLFWKIGG